LCAYGLIDCVVVVNVVVASANAHVVANIVYDVVHVANIVAVAHVANIVAAAHIANVVAVAANFVANIVVAVVGNVVIVAAAVMYSLPTVFYPHFYLQTVQVQAHLANCPS
jgi:hypothetical protein